MPTTPERIYLAGKIEPFCWRHQIVDNLRAKNLDYPGDGTTDEEPWPIFEQVIFGEHSFTGPHYMSMGHRMSHGPDSHGVDAGHMGPSRAVVLKQCFDAIRRSTFVFTWLDRPDAYGTLVEIGYALGHNISVIIALPEEPEDPTRPNYHVSTGYAKDPGNPDPPFTNDFWFALQAAQHVIYRAENPSDGLRRALRARGHHRTVWERLTADDA